MPVLDNVSRETYDDLDYKIKVLTNQPSLYEAYDVVGVIGHARGSQLDLNAAVQNIAKSASGDQGKKIFQNITQIEVYADRLSAQDVVQPPPGCDSMIIITRVAFAERKPVAIQLSGTQTSFSIELHCEPSKSPIELRVQFPDRKAAVQLTIPTKAEAGHQYWGIVVEQANRTGKVESFTDTGTTENLFECSTRSIADMIQDEQHPLPVGWDKYNDNLRRLLNYQLLLVSKVQDQDRTIAYQIAEFVINICQGIPKAFDLYSQASVMVASKAVGQDAMMTTLVPKVDLSTAQQVLKSRLDSAAAFDAANRDLQNTDANSKSFTLFANVALEKSVNSDHVYSFMTGAAEERLNSAQDAFYKAKTEFQTLQESLQGKQDAFKQGIEDWKTEQTKKIVGEVLMAVVAVAGGIALACAAPPAGVGAIGTGATELKSAVEGAEKAVGLWEKIKNIIERIQEIYEKLEPYLEKIKSLVESVSKIVELMKSKSSMDGVERDVVDKLILPTITSDDTVNSTADWDVFKLEMGNLYNGIKDEKIGGAEEFFTTIDKMVIRGKAIFAAQTALTAASGAYLTIIQQSIAQHKHTDRLRSAISQVSGSEKAFRIIKLAMAERMLALRSWIMLDFRQYVAAYNWTCLSASRPILLDPMKDVGSFLNDAATLQALSAQVYANVRAQTRVFHLSSSSSTTEKQNVFKPANFLETLRESRTVSFSLDCANPLFQLYGRLRLIKARIFLQQDSGTVSANGDSSNNAVSLRVTLGAVMNDLSLDKKETPDTNLPGSATTSALRVLNFVTTESEFGFEYTGNGNEKEVLMDGAFSGHNESSSLLLSPFRPWTVTVQSETDLESVTGLALELTCEVTYL